MLFVRTARIVAVLACAFAFGWTTTSSATLPGDSTSVEGLPIVEIPPIGTSGSTMAVILSGDGGWAAADKQMAAALAQRGIPVVGFDSPSYLSVKRTPDVAGTDLQRLLRHYLGSWHKQQVILIGYSHGADMAPFMVSRLPGDLRNRIALLAFVGLTSRMSFEFHLADLVADISREGDLPVLPELEKLRGMPLLCIQGAHEKNSLCPLLDPSLAQVSTHEGGHRLPGHEGSTVVDLIMAARQRVS
jgi:type IV secretory pathway VirJ component